MGRKAGLTALVLLVLIAPKASGQERPCIDINSAATAQLEQIIHIGPARAQQIIALRQSQPFRTVDDLTRVSGIATARLRDIKAQGLACVRATASNPSGTGDPNVPVNAPPTNRPSAACIDINTASESQLQRIVQIGPARAKQIIELRAARRFASVDDLVRVNGIAAGRLAEIKAQGLACTRASIDRSSEVAQSWIAPAGSRLLSRARIRLSGGLPSANAVSAADPGIR